jgi:hypothetical protein
MCNERYDRRHKKLWGMYTDEYSEGNPISFFVKKSRGQKFDITGKVFVPKEHLPEIIYDCEKAFDMITERLYTKSGKKQLRKTMYEELERDAYAWIVLINYLRQCYLEGDQKCLLSKKEIAMISKPLTKKQKRDKRLNKNFIGY